MKTLYRQFLITTVVIMIFSSLIGFFVANSYNTLVARDNNDAQNTEMAQKITAYIENTDTLHDTMELDSYFQTLGDLGYQLYVVNESGEQHFYGREFKKLNLLEENQQAVLDGEVYHGMQQTDLSFMMSYIGNEQSNTIGVPFEWKGERYAMFLRPDTSLLFSEVHTILMLMISVIAVISLISMLFVAKQLIRPITQLTQATKQIAQGKFDLLVGINRKDEIGQLSDSFNEMVLHLKENDRSRKEFISNVSHDFQSPLLNIQGYADLLKSPQITEEERLSYTAVIESETKRMSNLTQQLLLLSSLDQSTRRLNRSIFSLDQLIKGLAQKYMWQIEELEMEVYFQLAPVTFVGDQALLETAVDNLFSNALKYNKAKGTIQIEMVEAEEQVTISIQDQGIGLQVNEIPHLFERFYRADTSRTKEGTGLGLSIVKQIVELHDGTIQVSSVYGEGTRFEITLPKLPPAE